MLITEIFESIAETIAQLNPTQIIQLKAPKDMSERVSFLISKKKNNEINNEENIELERFLALDLFISLTKAKANILLNKSC